MDAVTEGIEIVHRVTPALKHLTEWVCDFGGEFVYLRTSADKTGEKSSSDE